MPSLAEIIDAKEDDLPHIYLVHPNSEKEAVPYPEKLDDVNKFSPELIIAWAEVTANELEIEELKQTLADPEVELEDGEKEELQEHLKESEELLKEAKDKLVSVKAEIAVENEFVKGLDEHFDVSEMHMTRIEQAHYEEEL